MPADTRPRRVLLIRSRYFGDVLLLGPCVAALRQAWPEARIDVLTEASFAEAAGLLPGVTRVWALPPRWTGWPALAWGLRSVGFSHLIDFDNRPRTALAAFLSGAGLRLAFPIGRAAQRGRFVYDRWCGMPQEEFDSRHMGAVYLWPLRDLGIAAAGAPPADTPFALAVPAADSAWCREAWPGLHEDRRAGEIRLLIHPGTRTEARRWPAERFADVCLDLRRRHPGLVVGVAAGGADDLPTLAAIRAALGEGVLDFGQSREPGRLGAWMARFDVFLGHDSGPAHLAAGLGLDVVCIANNQSMVQWQPLARRVQVLRAPSPCTPCLLPGQCRPGDSYHTFCVRKIAAGEVGSAVGTMITGRLAEAARMGNAGPMQRDPCARNPSDGSGRQP